MTYKTILAPITSEDTSPALMNTALLLAGRFQGHVEAKHIRQKYGYSPLVAYYPIAMDIPNTVSAQRDEAAAKFAHSLKTIVSEACDTSGAYIVPIGQALHQNGITVSWHDEPGILPTDYGRSARLSDLSVLCLSDKKGNGMETAIFESLLMSSARPVLLVPANGLETIPNRVLVAWDGSEPAARAIDAAMPFLDKAEAVFVVTIGVQDLETPSAQDAAAYLERHGIKAEAFVIDWPKKPIAERLLNQAEAHNCDLIVMGGYSHARIYETILGGVTNDMLQHNTDRAVLMAH